MNYEEQKGINTEKEKHISVCDDVFEQILNFLPDIQNEMIYYLVKRLNEYRIKNLEQVEEVIGECKRIYESTPKLNN